MISRFINWIWSLKSLMYDVSLWYIVSGRQFIVISIDRSIRQSFNLFISDKQVIQLSGMTDTCDLQRHSRPLHSSAEDSVSFFRPRRGWGIWHVSESYVLMMFAHLNMLRPLTLEERKYRLSQITYSPITRTRHCTISKHFALSYLSN